MLRRHARLRSWTGGRALCVQPPSAHVGPDRVRALARGDPVDPRRKLRGVAEISQTADCANPRFLHDVAGRFGGIARPAEHPCGVPQQSRRPPLRQAVQRFDGARLAQQNQVFVEGAFWGLVHAGSCSHDSIEPRVVPDRLRVHSGLQTDFDLRASSVPASVGRGR